MTVHDRFVKLIDRHNHFMHGDGSGHHDSIAATIQAWLKELEVKYGEVFYVNPLNKTSLELYCDNAPGLLAEIRDEDETYHVFTKLMANINDTAGDVDLELNPR